MTHRWVNSRAARWVSGSLVSAALVAAVSWVVALLDPRVPGLHLLVLYVPVIILVAIGWGTAVAAAAAILSAAVCLYLFVPPLASFKVDDWGDAVALGVFLVTAVVVGELAARSRRAATRSMQLTEEQSALRRVAVLVAQPSSPSVVFEAVTKEVGLLCGADLARMERYEADGTVTGLAAWSGIADHLTVGTRFDLDGLSVAREVRQRGGPVRLESYKGATGSVALEASRLGIRSSVGCPIVVDGHLWGVIAASRRSDEAFAPNAEAQIAEFTELVATAIANAQARQELRAVADEQAALRRVATLVAQAAPAPTLFAAVAEEIGRLIPTDAALVNRYDPDGSLTNMGTWSSTGHPLALGERASFGGGNVNTLVVQTGQAARIDRYGSDDTSAITAASLRIGLRSAVGAPINVAGRLWGAMIAGSTGQEALPKDTETRLAGFAELVATAIGNAQAGAELTASRARIVAAGDEARRQIERDLHDGAQQRLIALAMHLRMAQKAVPAGLQEHSAELGRVIVGLTGVLDELREIARGIHPAILAKGGLGPALRTLARRSPMPVQLEVRPMRLPERIEVTTYYVVSEALANAAKHASARVVRVTVELADDVLCVEIADDGVGGADSTRGSGLVGLKDRVEAAGGTMALQSRAGQGTRLVVKLPVDPAEQPGPD
jgi:signal transduction histidine kinase